jgi:hypothetical protein
MPKAQSPSRDEQVIAIACYHVLNYDNSDSKEDTFFIFTLSFSYTTYTLLYLINFHSNLITDIILILLQHIHGECLVLYCTWQTLDP